MSVRLRWGIKSSFLEYLAGLDDVVIETSGGASRGADGTFSWPGEWVQSGMSTTGRVLIRAHGGMLELDIADPALALEQERTVLEITQHGRRIIVATSNQVLTRGGVAELALTLTAAGAQAFGGVYPMGTPLDALTLIEV